MPKPALIRIPTEPIGSIPRPLTLIERVAQGGSEDANEDPDLAPFFEDAIRDTIERFEATGSPVVTDGEQRKYLGFATTACTGFPTRPRMVSPSHSQTVTHAACPGSQTARSGIGDTLTVTWISPCAMRTSPSSRQ